MNIKEFLVSEVTMTHRVYILTLVLAISLTLNGVFLLSPAPKMQTFADTEQPLMDRPHQVYHSAIIESPQAHKPIWQRIQELGIKRIGDDKKVAPPDLSALSPKH